MNYADKRVLIIEDQRPFLLVLRGLLHSMGATEVVTKSSAEQALSLCRKRKFDIIISDLHLGSDKKNGFEFIEELRSQKLAKPSTIVMLISADSTRPFVLGSIDRGPDDYLIKPFSQNQLKTRLERAWKKRQALLPVYHALHEGDTALARKQAEKLLATNRPYRGSVAQLLTGICWQQKDFAGALNVLSDFDTDRPVPWLQLALAKNWLKMNERDKALSMAQSVLQRNRFSAEAYDVVAECQLLNNDTERAAETIRHAIKISPYCTERHHIACHIARQHKDFVLASESAQAIWLLSRKTVKEHADIWCSYIRSILEVAENAEDKKTRNRYQQEAHLAVQRGKFDDYLSRNNDEFDFVIYEQIFTARLHSIEGKLIEAKRALNSGQEAIQHKYESYPQTYAPDSLKVMYAIGEYDEADALVNVIRSGNLHDSVKQMLDTDKQKAAEKQQLYSMHNKEGIEHYQQGDFKAARTSFTKALQFAPVNTGVALNLLQCVIKLLNTDTKEQPALLTDSKRLLKLLDGMFMKPQFLQKFEELRAELSGLTGKAA